MTNEERIIPVMTDWLPPLLQIGGIGAVLAVALFIMGRWLLNQIDARIERIEKMAEEQAYLTRTVESIKADIAAQVKSRDNRWAFRKDVYLNS